MNASLPRASLVAGPTGLPSGYRHPHASDQARLIAEAGLILRVQVGSGVQGTSMRKLAQERASLHRSAGVVRRSGPG